MRLIDYYTDNKNKSLLMIHCLFLFITTCFIFYFDYFLLSDYPNHLTKINLYNHLSDTQNILSQYYYKNWQITPYMAFDVIVGFLEPLVGIHLAGKIFIVLALSGIVSGGIFLNYTLYNRITPFSLFIHIFIFNFTFSMGFMNFTLGLGVALWGYGLWIRYYKHTIKFYCVFALYAMVVFFAHVFALFILGVVVGLYQLSLSPKSNITDFFKSSLYAGFRVLSFTIVPIVITMLISNQRNHFTVPLVTQYHEDLATNFFVSYVTPLVFHLEFFYAVVVLTLFMILIVLKRIELGQSFVLSVLFIFGLCVPFYVGGVACSNERIPAFVGLLFAASATLKNEKKNIILCSVSMGIFCAFLYINNINLLYTHNAWASEFIKAIKDDDTLKGKRLITVNNNDDVHFHNLSNYATFTANMLDPALFTHIPPVSMYKKYTKIYGCQQSPIVGKELRMLDKEAQKYIKSKETKEKTICPNGFYWRHWRDDFDFVFWIHADKKPKNVPSELVPYKKGSFFTLYKINKKEN